MSGVRSQPLHDRYDPRSANTTAPMRFKFLTAEPVSETTETIEEGLVLDRRSFDPHTREFHEHLNRIFAAHEFDGLDTLRADVECAQRSGPVRIIQKAAGRG